MSIVNMKEQDGLFQEYGVCVNRFPRSIREAYGQGARLSGVEYTPDFFDSMERSWKPVLAVLVLLIALLVAIHLVSGVAA